MGVIKCKMCGGDLNISEDSTVAECEYCGSVQTVPTTGSEKEINLFARANRLRLACEFDKAAGVYENIVAEFPEEAEAYWGLVLCRYGIEYMDDSRTGKKIPTCHRSSFDSIMEDSDFEQVLENADVVARRVYREEAKAIEKLRKGILEVSGKEEPYDIFICYKETDEKGNRTIDSVIAQDVYDALTAKGYRVFFSRISLEDKLGTEYEPYIFAALNSAKVMLAFGTDYEYFNAVWVKNEWSRFLALIATGKKKTLIPCYKGIDAYDMPKEFSKLQAQDMGKVGAIQDLLRGIDKTFKEDKPAATGRVSLGQQLQEQEQTKADNTVQLGTMVLNSGDIQKAVQYYEEGIKINSDHVGAYIGLVRALDYEKSRPYCNRLETFPLEIVAEYLRCNPDMLVGQPVSLLDRAVSTLLPLEFIKLLLGLGADNSNEYILYHAIVSKRTDKYDLIKMLLDSGINPNKEYTLKFFNVKYQCDETEICTPLRDAIWQAKDPQLAELLIDYGANVNYISKCSNNDSWSLLDMAVRTNNADMVRLLLKRGADANSGKNINDYYPGFGIYCVFHPTLSDAICVANNSEIVTLLLEYGADPNITYERYPNVKEYLTPLADAILFGSSIEILKILLYAGANLEARYKYAYSWDDNIERGCSLLELAETRGNEAAKQLLQLEQQKVKKRATINQLEAKKASLQKEISLLNGMFAGVRRKIIESQLAEIDSDLKILRGSIE